MPSTRLGGAGTPHLWKRSSLPEIWCRDCVTTQFNNRITPTRPSARLDAVEGINASLLP